MMFSAKDQDNDQMSDMNCAQIYVGGWWYNACYFINPTGATGHANYVGFGDFDLAGSWTILKTRIMMKIAD